MKSKEKDILNAIHVMSIQESVFIKSGKHKPEWSPVEFRWVPISNQSNSKA